MKRAHDMPFGANMLDSGGVSFALWAPDIDKIVLEHGLGGAVARDMERNAAGWHRLAVADARAGDRYCFRLPDGLCVPDPASRFNPDEVHNASQVIDPHAYIWKDGAWRGRAWSEAVIYELHVGAFTHEGTFAAAERQLAQLAELGITVVELMPLANFPGSRGWGYDGVLPFAPYPSYGTPDALKSLIDTAHGLGLMMLIDVVYNHFGPEGNYLHAYCPQFFNSSHQTPWGAAINYDGAESRTVRDFFIHNALYWVNEFHFDGLRMDAIHAIHDESGIHIVRELCEALHAGPGKARQVHVVLENDANQASLLERDKEGVPLAGTAQWNDDLHHAAHVLVTGETDGYYADYADAPLAQFGRALAQGFIYQGQPSNFRDGEPRGEPSAHLPLAAFISFLQTHDQVGNRALGDRIHTLGDPLLLRTAYSCLLLSPHTPMLFMGEEFLASTPFQYFCDFGGALAEAVRTGRRDEFKDFAAFRDPLARARIPDPNAAETFVASKLDWAERARTPHCQQLALVRELLAVRREHLIPRLTGQAGGGRYSVEGKLLRVVWTLQDGGGWSILANFGNSDVVSDDEATSRSPVYVCGVHQLGGARLRLEPGAVRVAAEACRG